LAWEGGVPSCEGPATSKKKTKSPLEREKKRSRHGEPCGGKRGKKTPLLGGGGLLLRRGSGAIKTVSFQGGRREEVWGGERGIFTRTGENPANIMGGEKERHPSLQRKAKQRGGERGPPILNATQYGRREEPYDFKLRQG